MNRMTNPKDQGRVNERKSSRPPFATGRMGRGLGPDRNGPNRILVLTGGLPNLRVGEVEHDT